MAAVLADGGRQGEQGVKTIGTSAAADLIFTSGAVYTVDDDDRWAEAVAIKEGHIAAVGDDAEIREHAGPHTEVVDLAGKMLLPGFQDAHVHPAPSGLGLIGLDLSQLTSIPAYVEAVRTYADAHPDEAWIHGGGWRSSLFPDGEPLAAQLDEAMPDRPVFLHDNDGHKGWVNSRAMKLADITGDTSDPFDGKIARDTAGDPSGTLVDSAMNIVCALIPEPDPETKIRGLLAAQKFLHALGITAWQEAQVGEGMSIVDAYDAYVTLSADGRLTARVVGSLYWDPYRGEEQLEELIDRRARAASGRFRATTAKIFQDGVIEGRTAALIEPYLDPDGSPTDDCGPSFVDPEALKTYVTALDREDFQVHFHTIGDRATREALDAVSTARATNGPSDHRHHLSHLQIIHPDDLPRFRELDTVANVQPLWAAHEPQLDELALPLLGPERAAQNYPFASLVRHGARLAFGSDWSVTSPNPIWILHTAVNRTEPAKMRAQAGLPVREPFLPAERLDLATALRAATMGSAYVNHLEGETGSIKVGKLADLVVLDRDLFACPPDGFADAKVLLTLVAGEKVYEAPGL